MQLYCPINHSLWWICGLESSPGLQQWCRRAGPPDWAGCLPSFSCRKANRQMAEWRRNRPEVQVQKHKGELWHRDEKQWRHYLTLALLQDDNLDQCTCNVKCRIAAMFYLYPNYSGLAWLQCAVKPCEPSIQLNLVMLLLQQTQQQQRSHRPWHSLHAPCLRPL